ncbi:NAD(P)H dehydrogenase (quinone) [Thalassovita taeanensis]|uniref:NAD(P)H dehydrogenase (Quinone) n=1 Tax=Thalassovita taeanensis TaxID=657014 RepID=A0A1H9HBJ2_9RHOB|nr:NAD(P)H dehydrogenase (quinone) [Thalassovita taeanensis]
MKVLIVYAHNEPKSFSAALLERSIRCLTEAGHEIRVSDLYEMGFNPVASADDFESRRFSDALQYDREQKFSHEQGAFAQDIQTEIDKLLWCDTLILQFPLWWWSVPAIMKGWIDRVLVNGVAYGKGKRMNTGGLKGRRAMLSLTSGCYPDMVAPDGLLGDLKISLWHLHSGTLAYTGFEVLEPFVAWSIHYSDPAKLAEYLDEYEARLATIATEEPMFFHPLEDFGPDWRMKGEINPNSVGHRRDGEKTH